MNGGERTKKVAPLSSTNEETRQNFAGVDEVWVAREALIEARSSLNR